MSYLPTRCEICNSVFDLDEADVVGADDGNIFCPVCGQEIHGGEVEEKETLRQRNRRVAKMWRGDLL